MALAWALLVPAPVSHFEPLCPDVNGQVLASATWVYIHIHLHSHRSIQVPPPHTHAPPLELKHRKVSHFRHEATPGALLLAAAYRSIIEGLGPVIPVRDTTIANRDWQMDEAEGVSYSQAHSKLLSVPLTSHLVCRLL